MLLKRSKWLTFVVAFAICLSLFTLQAKAKIVSKEFTDVPKDKPYASAVYDLAKRNIIGGYKDGTFKPEATITRGQAAAIIAKLLNLDTKNVKDPGFKDVSSKLWSYGAIAAVSEKEIFRGYADGRFGPNDPITRGQMASILIKAFEFHYYNADYQDSPFKDIERLESHKDAVYTLYKLGITSGTTPTTFSPNNPITRAQAAVLITKTERARSATVTLNVKDYGWSKFREYEDYHDRYRPEQNEEEIIQVIPSNTNARLLQIVPVKVGTQKLSIAGLKVDATGSESRVYKKYYVHVTKDSSQLKINFEETEDVLPTNVGLNAKKESIEKISLSTMNGTILNDNMEFKNCKYMGSDETCITLTEPGEYIATVKYVNGTQVRYGIQATVNSSSFYFGTRLLEENPTVTVDLSEDKGDFSEYEIKNTNGSDVIKFTREGNSDIFHIEGVSEGNVYIDFPKNDEGKEGLLGLNINVQKIGSIIHVVVNRDYYDPYH